MPGQRPYTEEEQKRKDDLLRKATEAEQEFSLDELEQYSDESRRLELILVARTFGVDINEYVERCGSRKDPFIVLGSMLKGIPEEEVTKADRMIYKDRLFGVRYGVPASNIVDYMNYFGPRGVTTGRLTTREPRMQNIPIRSKKDGDGK